MPDLPPGRIGSCQPRALGTCPLLFVVFFANLRHGSEEEGPQDDPGPIRDKTASDILSRAPREER